MAPQNVLQRSQRYALGLADSPFDFGGYRVPFICSTNADERHRGYTGSETGKWRETLDHFDAIKIGLTATPAVHTTAYFGRPVTEYGFDRAVREGYLIDYEPAWITSRSTGRISTCWPLPAPGRVAQGVPGLDVGSPGWAARR